MKNKFILILLIVLNSIVLLGQLWPEGAPPFARIVNIVTLVCNLALLLSWRIQVRSTGIIPRGKEPQQ